MPPPALWRSEIFSSPLKETRYPLALTLHCPPAWKSPVYFLSMNLPVLNVSYRLNCTTWDVLRQDSLTQRSVSEAHPRCSINQYLTPFYGELTLNRHCSLLIHASVPGHFGCFYLVAVGNLCEQVCVWVPVFSSCRSIPGSGIAESHG